MKLIEQIQVKRMQGKQSKYILCIHTHARSHTHMYICICTFIILYKLITFVNNDHIVRYDIRTVKHKQRVLQLK